MQQSVGQRPISGPAVLGLLLIAVGASTLVLRDMGYNLFEAIGSWGWPFFVIVPGLVLLGFSLVPAPPKGVGFAIAGSIVTAIGALLLYQSQTGHFESWAYAWAFLPLAAGGALVAYGLLAGQRSMVSTGTTLAGIAVVLLVVGAWFFEGLFAGESRPAQIGEWWPIVVIVLGAVILVRAFLTPARPTEPPLPLEQATHRPTGPAHTV